MTTLSVKNTLLLTNSNPYIVLETALPGGLFFLAHKIYKVGKDFSRGDGDSLNP